MIPISVSDVIEMLEKDLDNLLDIDEGNQKEALNSLTLCYKIRHDVFHKSLAVISDCPDAMVERKIKYFIESPEHIGKFTPDLFLMFDKSNNHVTDIHKAFSVIIADVSVSIRSNEESERKTAKYIEVKRFLEEKIKATVTLHIINIDNKLTNMELQINNFLRLMNRNCSQEDLYLIRHFVQRVEQTILFLKTIISDELLIKKYFDLEFENKAYDPNEITNINYAERIRNMSNISFKEKNRNKVLKNHIDESVQRMSFKEQLTKDELKLRHEKEFEDVCNIANDLLNDNTIREYFTEKETTSMKIQNAYKFLEITNAQFDERDPKPSHHIMTPLLSYPDDFFIHEVNPIRHDCWTKLRLEQKQITRILYTVARTTERQGELYFVKELWKTMKNTLENEHSDFNINMFEKGIYLNKETDVQLRDEFQEYKKQSKTTKTKMRSFIDFLREVKKEDVPRNNDDRFIKQKIIRVNMENKEKEFVSFWKKSHSGYIKEKTFQDKKRKTCNFNDDESIDNFLELLTEDDPNFKEEGLFTNFYKKWNSYDNEMLSNLKDTMVDHFNVALDEIRNVKAYSYLMNQSLVAEQLMHFQQFTLPTNSFSVFTCGMPNTCIILNNSYHDIGKDVGKAFICCGIIDDLRWINKIFGKVKYEEIYGHNRKMYIFATNWRRLETYKCTFLKDQFYSVLSTSVNGLLRHEEKIKRDRRGIIRTYTRQLVKHHFSLKVLVSLNSNQRVAEMLADMRYAIMASFAEFSEIERLCTDKFAPPYNNSLEVWIAKRVDNLRKLTTDYLETKIQNIFFKQPIFHGKRRTEDSIGGHFEIPSIWDGVIINDLQDLLDDMFLYVHTLKEPSNIHHENIKAVNTILEYQEKYNNMNEKRKKGNFEKLSDLKQMLLDEENPIGHSQLITSVSSHRTMDTLRGMDWTSRLNKILNEPISNITSTKAAIPEYDRNLVEVNDEKKNKKKISKNKATKSLFVKEYSKYKNIETEDYIPKLIKNNIPRDSFLPTKIRSKVHDCILDIIEQNNYIKTVFDLAEWNVLSNNSKTVADICIKAQYGAKREFYVINVGSKACARVLENIFQELCKQLPNEMISIPGDKKMLYMQDFLNQTLSRKQSNERIFFVNGDCTKWSAAETMECFISLIEGLHLHLPTEIIEYLMMIINMWGNKDITIPISLLQNTFFTTEEKTKYLRSHMAVLESDQNFLQGMFNYMSSFKAVCCSNLTREIWRTIRPDSKLRMEHMEHSDDYSLIITTQNIEELKEFRCLHRILMKCHGFNDSVKKTNTQQFLMEFISLLSFNGHMTYPHIKKLKECGMNLGCTGYRDDIDAVLSRVGESVRVGSTLTSAYFMQRIHLANLTRSYSLNENQQNCIYEWNQIYNVPVELFGIPDTFPLFSFLCKGTVNNYRLLQYAPDDEELNIIVLNKSFKTTTKKLLTKLIALEKAECEYNQLILNEDFTEGIRLYHPTYTFDVENNLIKKIRTKLPINFEESIDFWEKHKSYNFVKPVDRHLLITWMRAIYFRQNFALAYSRNSRSQITLRLSTFTTKKCLLISKRDKKNDFETYSIKEYLFKFFSDDLPIMTTEFYKINEVTDQDVKKASMNNDSTASMMYSFYNGSRYIEAQEHNLYTVASLSPQKISWITINNNAGTLMQYIFNFDDFKKDARSNLGVGSLEADKKVIEKYYGANLNEETPLHVVKSVYSDIVLSQKSRNLCMTYKTETHSLEDFLRYHTELGTIYHKKLEVYSIGITEAINPHDLSLYYKKIKTYSKNPLRVLIDDCTLVYSLLRHSYKVDLQTLKQILYRLKIKPQKYDQRELGDLNMEKLIEDFDIDALKQIGFNLNELKMHSFIKAFLKDDYQPITDLSNENTIYSYQYVDVPSEDSDIIKEIVLFEFQKTNFKAYRFKRSNTIIIQCEHRGKKMLADAWLISMKLFGIITNMELEKRITQTTLKDIMTTLQGKTVDKFLSQNRLKLFMAQHDINSFLDYDEDFKRSKMIDYNNKIETLSNLIFISAQFNDNITAGKSEKFFKPITIDWETSSVFMGTKKIYTLPLLSCTQSNITECYADLNLNGTTLNWWLESSRIQHFVHEENVPINKADFESFGRYNIKKYFSMLSIYASKSMSLVNGIPLKLETANVLQINSDLKERIKNMTYDITKMPPNRQTDIIEEFDPFSINYEIEEDDDDYEDYSKLEDSEGLLPADIMKNLMLEMNIDLSSFKAPVIESDEDSNSDYEEILIRNEEDSSKGSNSSEINQNFLTKEEYQKSMPNITSSQVNFVKSKSFSTNTLDRLGDPTTFLLQNQLITVDKIRNYSMKEKIVLIKQLLDIISLSKYITDLELATSVIILNALRESIEFRTEWKLNDDLCFKQDKDGDYNIFIKYEDNLTDAIRERAISKGAFIERVESTPWIFIPLPKDRKTKMIEAWSESTNIKKIIPESIINDCYNRLFEEPHHRIGHVLQLLDEL